MLSGLAIVCLLPNSPVVVALSLLWAVTVAASRVFLGRHYVSDVLGGVLLGVTVTAAITQGTFSEEGLAINKHVLSNAMAKLLRTWNH